MSKLQANFLDKSLKGEHVLRHKHGIWNQIWSDMMIETWFKIGKGPTGIIGKTNNQRIIQKQAKSQLTWSKGLQDLDALRQRDDKKWPHTKKIKQH